MARNQWDAWLQGGQTPSSQAWRQPVKGYNALTGSDSPIDPSVYRPNVIKTGRDDAANGPNFGGLGTSMNDAWYADIPAMNFNEFIGEENSDWFRREWVKSHGMGQQTEEALARFSPVPRYWLSALGQDKKFSLNQPNSPQRQADLMGKLYGRLLGPSSGAIDPKAIMQKVIGSTWNSKNVGKNGYMENMISNPDLSPDSQISNFWTFVNGTVGRLLPPGTMTSYRNIINREGDLFRDFMAKNPAVSLTFNKWIEQRLGPTGGL